MKAKCRIYSPKPAAGEPVPQWTAASNNINKQRQRGALDRLGMVTTESFCYNHKASSERGALSLGRLITELQSESDRRRHPVLPVESLVIHWVQVNLATNFRLTNKTTATRNLSEGALWNKQLLRTMDQTSRHYRRMQKDSNRSQNYILNLYVKPHPHKIKYYSSGPCLCNNYAIYINIKRGISNMVRNETNSIIKRNPKSNLNFFFFFFYQNQYYQIQLKKRLEHIYI